MKYQIVIWTLVLAAMLCGCQDTQEPETPEEEPVVQEFPRKESYQEKKYRIGSEAMEDQNWQRAIDYFKWIPDYLDASQLLEKATQMLEHENQRAQEEAWKKAYAAAEELRQQGEILAAAQAFDEIKEYSDARAQAQECWYQQAETYVENGDTRRAAIAFGKAGDYQDARDKSMELWDKVAIRKPISTWERNTSAIGENGYPRYTSRSPSEVVMELPAPIVAICEDRLLCQDGTVISDFAGRRKIEEVHDVVALSHDYGLRADGTLIRFTEDGLVFDEEFENVVAVDGCFGLFADGTIQRIRGYAEKNHEDVILDQWSQEKIVAISCSQWTWAALCADGRVLVDRNWIDVLENECTSDGYVIGWNDIIDIAAADTHMVALHADGTVSAIGENEEGACDVETWRDVVAVTCDNLHTIGVTSDGRILVTGMREIGEYIVPLPDEIREWTANTRYLRTRVE